MTPSPKPTRFFRSSQNIWTLMNKLLAPIQRNSKVHKYFPINIKLTKFIRTLYVVKQSVCKLGLTQWNLSKFEFKFDDSRLSSWYKNRNGLIYFFLLPPDVALSLPCWLSQFSFSKLRQPTGQRQSKVRMQQRKFSIMPIFFLYYEESLVSSNLNSRLLRFHFAHPSAL